MTLTEEGEALRDSLHGRTGWRVVSELVDRLKDMTFERDASIFLLRRLESIDASAWFAGWHEGHATGQLNAIAELYEAYEACGVSVPDALRAWATVARARCSSLTYDSDLC